MPIRNRNQKKKKELRYNDGLIPVTSKAIRKRKSEKEKGKKEKGKKGIDIKSWINPLGSPLCLPMLHICQS